MVMMMLVGWLVGEDGLDFKRKCTKGIQIPERANSTFNGKKLCYNFNGCCGLVFTRVGLIYFSTLKSPDDDDGRLVLWCGCYFKDIFYCGKSL